MKFQNMTGV